jgi:hypothetical protein
MHGGQFTEHANGTDGAAPASGSGGAPRPAWQRIAQIPVPADGADGAVGDAIAASLPAALTSAGLRAAIRQAVLAAVARQARQSGYPPRAVIVSQHFNAAGAQRGHAGNGWSFFVVERPAPGGQDAGEAVELFLYCDCDG